MRIDLLTLSLGAVAAALSVLFFSRPLGYQSASKAHASDLLQTFECGRCHELSSNRPEWSVQTNCLGCHKAILAGELDGRLPSEVVEHGKQHIVHLVVSPSLATVKDRLSARWVESYLMRPHQVRPLLGASMPRLPLSGVEAKAIAGLLYGENDARDEEPPPGGNAASGRGLLKERGCLACHWFSGTDLPVESLPAGHAQRLAPDFRFTRERMTRGKAWRWLLDPSAIDPRTLMPPPVLSDGERLDVVAALFDTALAAPSIPSEQAIRNKSSQEHVSFYEVQQRILNRTCRHCHSNPERVGPDAGPGNTGGFGFDGKGLDLTSREGLEAGAFEGTSRKRSSVLEPRGNLPPRIIEALRARKREERGEVVGDLRGMPLGFPSVPEEDIQLLEKWIEGGMH